MSEEERDKLIEEQIGTIERLERQLEWYDRTLEEKQKEITKRDKIIKEVRKYIEHENFKRNILVGVSTKKYTRDILNKILKILEGSDKE